MPATHPLILSRHFLATAVFAGAISLLVPVSSARAATTPPGGGSTLTAPATAAPQPTTTTVESAIIGAATAAAAGDESIRPFKFHATDAQLADLKRRIAATQWPERENDPTQGVHLATIRKLADYWAEPARLATRRGSDQ